MRETATQRRFNNAGSQRSGAWLCAGETSGRGEVRSKVSHNLPCFLLLLRKMSNARAFKFELSLEALDNSGWGVV